MGTTPGKAPVPAPPRPQPRMGLIPSSRTNLGANPSLPSTDPLTGAPLRWEGGLQYVPEHCGGGTTLDPCVRGSSAVDANPANVEDDPLVVETGVECDSSQLGAEDQVAKVRRKLDSVTPTFVEHEFWTGDLATANAMPNNFLANAASLTDLSPGPAGAPRPFALAALQQALAETAEGGRGAIHAPRQLVTLWQADGLVSREAGSFILTDLYDNLVIPGVGYTGGGPRQAQVDSLVIDATGGTFDLTVDGNLVAGIAWDVTDAALTALLAAEVPGTTVTGGPGGTAALVITWGGTEAHVVVPDGTNLTGGAGTATLTNTQAGGSAVDATGVLLWAYATDLTDYRQTEPVAMPGDTTPDMVGTPLTEDNIIEQRAHRLAVVSFDACRHFAIAANVCDTCCEG